jgi:hypothetical protein
MKNRTREICTSGTVRDEGGNILIYSAPAQIGTASRVAWKRYLHSRACSSARCALDAFLIDLRVVAELSTLILAGVVQQLRVVF